MKKALLAAVLAVVSMLGGLPAQTAAAEEVVPAACHEEWMGIRDFPKDLDSRRFVNLRMAWRVTYCDGAPRSLKTYLAVYCHFDGLPWPCSFSWTVVAQDHGTVYEDSENVNPNTGSDGFASRYGPSRNVTRCHTYHVYGSISRVGVAGVSGRRRGVRLQPVRLTLTCGAGGRSGSGARPRCGPSGRPCVDPFGGTGPG